MKEIMELNQKQDPTQKNALVAGLDVQLLIFPFRCWAVDEQLAFLAKQFEGKKINKLWISWLNRDECSWSGYSAEDNCKYLQELIQKGSEMGINVNIRTSSIWRSVFGSRVGCPEVSKTSLLWWDRYAEGDLPDYRQIGGWESPDLIFLGPAGLCGREIYPSQVVNKAVI